MKSRYFRLRRWYPHYEGEGEGENESPGTGTESGAGTKTSTGGGDEKKFSQKDLDRLIDKRFKAERQQNEKLLQQLQAIQQNGLTPEAREELEGQITRLQESMQSKEQTLQQKMAENEKKLNKLIETEKSEKDLWKSRYHKTMIERSILDAAIAVDGEEPSQFVMMFGPNARLEEQVDAAGKGTGEFITKVKINGIDPETKKPAVLDLPPAEAFNHLREHGLHKNLFKHNATGGTGKPANGASGGNNNAGNKMPERSSFQSEEDFSAAYQTWRESFNPDGSPIKKA
jgi:hypothetical protein